MDVPKVDDVARFSFLPIKHHNLIKKYHEQKKVMWMPGEIDMAADRADWDKLDENTKQFLKFILAFFAQFDGIVNENIDINFAQDVKHIKEAGFFYKAQEFMETLHNETYSLMIESFIRNDDEKQKMFNAIAHYKSIAEIAQWAAQWMNPHLPLTHRLLAFACIEGVLFTGAFCSIYWIKKRSILKGLCKANEFIARDEAIHTEFAAELYTTLTTITYEHPPITREDALAIINSFIVVTEVFVKDALHVDLIGMSSYDMMAYIKCAADSLLRQFRHESYFNCPNPFTWMATIGLKNKTNFFEETVSEYSKNTDNDFTFTTDEPF
jgi:ribonucleotide reductase beta subunit family protein with ferritin-like domain